MNLYEPIYYKDHKWYVIENEGKIVLLLNDILGYTIYDKVEQVLKEFALKFDINGEVRLPTLYEIKNIPTYIKKLTNLIGHQLTQLIILLVKE